MKIPSAGEVFRGISICDWCVGTAMAVMSPAGIERFLGSRKFSVCNRHLGQISLGIVYLDRVGDYEPVSVRCDDGEEIRGNVLIFGFNGTLKPLEDFELEAIRSNLELEKSSGICTVVLNNVAYRENKPVEAASRMIEQASYEKLQEIRP